MIVTIFLQKTISIFIKIRFYKNKTFLNFDLKLFLILIKNFF